MVNVEQRAELPSVKPMPEVPHTASASRRRNGRPREIPSKVPENNGGTSNGAAITARYYDKPWRPSGDLLKDMRDPNRPRSSVPDPLPDAFGEAPRSEVFEEPE